MDWMRSTQRLPRSDWGAPWSRRISIGWRIARSAALLSGLMCTSGTSAKVHSASYSSSSPAAKFAVRTWQPEADCSSSVRIRSRSKKGEPVCQPLVLVVTLEILVVDDHLPGKLDELLAPTSGHAVPFGDLDQPTQERRVALMQSIDLYGVSRRRLQ